MTPVSPYIAAAVARARLGIRCRVFPSLVRDDGYVWAVVHPQYRPSVVDTPAEATRAYLRLVRELEGQ